jgi:hypothetical protein
MMSYLNRASDNFVQLLVQTIAVRNDLTEHAVSISIFEMLSLLVPDHR